MTFKRILFLIISTTFFSCNLFNNENKIIIDKKLNEEAKIEIKEAEIKEAEIKEAEIKELNAADIYNSSLGKVALIISYDQEGIPFSQGSGFFINNDSLVTNYHVIEGASRVEIKLLGNESIIRNAKVIAASEKHDLAIIKTNKSFDYYNIDSLYKDAIGSRIFTIGNPRGLEGTISEGIISAKRKEDYDLIQITAPISPGNSGGPLINEKGYVIGVSTFTFKNSQNLNFSVPIKYISECKNYVSKPITKRRNITKNKTAISMTNFKKNKINKFELMSFRNNTQSFIKSLSGVIIYKSYSGEIIDYQVINSDILIPPNLAKQMKIRSFDQDMNYSNKDMYKTTFKDEYVYAEFRLLSYEIEE